ncbi:hypothetical protein [Paraglaciecola polaris]|uniref:Cache domain-containing protein n=2 Tax=Paraglaciecola polaris TaxID=222814 RepID=K6ZNM1_9ALTE|nr:hypothetical protein [Paraglaciecola polaris]GAC31882.1 hypothetical protein GPLA_0966 [Paraglaciecola polaris LMG 21857]|tara:strand:+ start:39747 stop:44135 length:4389 start_codon:yes stop_codon:yes gene_type:complete
MSAKSVAQNTLSPPKTPKRRVFLLFIILLSAAGLYTYLYYSNIEEGSSNNNLYRILYEASNTLNENLDKIKRAHEYSESETSIRSLLPSYQRVTSTPLRSVSKSLTYTLSAQQINIQDPKKVFNAKLDVEDILPIPQAGFSQYLFANKDGVVLASTGHEKTISIVDLTSINRAFLRQETRSLLSMADEGKPSGDKVPLPSYSSHIDITLSYGKYRVFAFPFALDIPITYQYGEKSETLNHLYLIGLLPRAKLIQQSTTSWNASLLVVSLVSLLFMLALVRLFLLPITHSITPTNRNLTHLISYAFFIVVLSMLLAYLQKYVVGYNKDQQAVEYAKIVAQNIQHDVFEVFDKLHQYRSFYQLLQQSTAYQKQKDTPPIVLPGAQTSQLIEGDLLAEFHTALLSISDIRCQDMAKPDNAKNDEARFSDLPNAAASSDAQFSLNYYCDDENHLSLTSDLNATNLSRFLHSDDIAPENAQIIDFFARNLSLNLTPNESLETYISTAPESNHALNLLNVFLLNKDGAILTPSFYFVENNVLPEGFELSNRDYFKKIRDHKGWTLPNRKIKSDGETPQRYTQVYIQRLLNVNNATRGTTISMPLYTADYKERNLAQDHSPKANRYADVIAADVLLPRVSLAPPAPMDMTFMVVDRDNGDVLFHGDASRSLVENLYFSGNHSPILSQRIRAALDKTASPGASVNNAINGFYHGQAGRFFVQPSIIDKWAVVVFYPDDSLDALMTSQFMFLCISFAVFVTVLALISWLLARVFDTDKLKQVVNLPATFDTKEMLHLCSTLIGIMYCLFTFTHLIIYPKENAGYFLWIIACTLLLIFYFGYRGYKLLFESAGESFSIHKKGKKGALFLAVGLGALALGQAFYLNSVMTIPLKNLSHYYQYQQCNKFNRERAEIAAIGLTRFPNSITKHRMDAAALLNGHNPIETPHNKSQQQSKQQCENYSTVVTPDDFPNALDLINATQDWPWLDSFITFSHTPEPNNALVNDASNMKSFNMPIWATIFGLCAITLVLLAWLHFNRVTLWQRLYYSSFFLRHIRSLNLPMSDEKCDQISPQLTLKVDSAKPNGIDLTTLLHLTELHKPRVSQQVFFEGMTTLPCFALLLQISPCLRRFKTEKIDLPNIKMTLRAEPNGQGFNLEIWDIEVCLEVPKHRSALLTLLMELKSLVLLGKISRLTLYAGFYSLQRVKMKDPLAQVNDTAKLAHADYLSWADCLLDFNVQLPSKITQQIDQEVMHDEIHLFADLACLFPCVTAPEMAISELTPPFNLTNWLIWENLSSWHKSAALRKAYTHLKRASSKLYSTRYWATINYILLIAGALYRYKWELCSNAEKLALYNLAKGHYINPKNSEMIEHLALAGLIKVQRRHVTIINQSFAHFVRHAESAQTMNQLVNDGEAGTWKNYRLPLGLLLVLVIGAVALTSGQSLYIIAASLAGVIGTIASLTTSANMLRGHLKD